MGVWGRGWGQVRLRRRLWVGDLAESTSGPEPAGAVARGEPLPRESHCFAVGSLVRSPRAADTRPPRKRHEDGQAVTPTAVGSLGACAVGWSRTFP